MLDVLPIQCASDTANWHEPSSLIKPYHSCLLTDPHIDFPPNSMTPLFLAHPVLNTSSAHLIGTWWLHLSESFWVQSESNIKACNFAFDMLDEFRQSRKFEFWSGCRLCVLVPFWTVFILRCSKRRLPWKEDLISCEGDCGCSGFGCCHALSQNFMVIEWQHRAMEVTWVLN